MSKLEQIKNDLRQYKKMPDSGTVYVAKYVADVKYLLSLVEKPKPKAEPDAKKSDKK